MENAISGRNLPVLNCSYHLPKAWTNRFAPINSRQPRFGTIRRDKSHTCDLWYWENSWFPVLVHTSQSCKKILNCPYLMCHECKSWSLLRIQKGFVDYSLLILIEGNQNSCAVVFYRSAFTWLPIMSSTPPPTTPPPPPLTSLLPCSIRTLQLGLKREKKMLATPLNEITVCQWPFPERLTFVKLPSLKVIRPKRAKI